MAKDPELQAHLEWIWLCQPVGLVVSEPALLAAQAQINRKVNKDSLSSSARARASAPCTPVLLCGTPFVSESTFGGEDSGRRPGLRFSISRCRWRSFDDLAECGGCGKRRGESKYRHKR